MSTGARPKTSKKGHYVPSRYKQAAEQVSNRSKETSIFVKSGKDSQGLQSSGNFSQVSSDTSKAESTRGVTSTPTEKGTFPLLFDASAITGPDGHLTVPHLKESIAPATNYMKKISSKKFNVTRQTVLSQKENKQEKFNKKIAEAEMDLLYCYYVQSAYLESEAKKALEEKSSKTMESLHKLFTLVLQHMNQVKSLKLILKVFSSLIEIHRACEKQEAILEPVFKVFPELQKKYQEMAIAIDHTKHKLHVKDVILPESDCENEVEGDTMELLQKMRAFIIDFFEHLPDYKEIIQSSDSLKDYVDVGQQINEGLRRSFDLLIEARDMCFKEASLSLTC